MDDLTVFLASSRGRVNRVGNVSYPGKGECADPVNEDAILEEGGGGQVPGPE
jgi:hypothetical protein